MQQFVWGSGCNKEGGSWLWGWVWGGWASGGGGGGGRAAGGVVGSGGGGGGVPYDRGAAAKGLEVGAACFKAIPAAAFLRGSVSSEIPGVPRCIDAAKAVPWLVSGDAVPAFVSTLVHAHTQGLTWQSSTLIVS